MTAKPNHQRDSYGCDGKVRFEDIAIARQAAKRRKGRRPYRCKHCRGWHVGSNPPKPMRRK